jgi:hypothetical protein
MTFFRLVSVLCTAIALVAPATAADPMAEAKHLFSTYVGRLNAFDPAVADLYADDAKIENTRKYPDGTKRTGTVPAPKYKAMLRDAMPGAKQRHDTSEFFKVDYAQAGEKVRIETTRFSSAKKEATPLTLVVGAGTGGKWMILEEYSESRPERSEE